MAKERESVGDRALRAELAALRIKALVQRAEAVGVSEEDLNAAEDADDFKAALVTLIVVQTAASGGPRREDVRAELKKLKLRSLKKRAAAAGVAEEALEAAKDADNYMDAIIELIVSRECAAASAAAALRTELSGMRLTALIKRASAAGVSEASLDDAEDGEDHKGALVDLILAHAKEATDNGSSNTARAVAALRAELSVKKLRALMERATAAGVPEDQLDEAEDEEDHRGALIDLIVSSETARKVDVSTPHHKLIATRT